MSQSLHRGRAAIAAALLAAQLVSWGSPVLAAPASGGTTNVAKGQEYYEQSRFDEAIGLLKDLVDRGALQGDDLQHARELLARSYVKKGYPVQGKEMFKAILRANPQWRPDPIRVPPDETAVFEQALKEYTTEAAGGTPPAPGGNPPATSTAPPASTPAPAEPASPPPPKHEPTPATALMPESSEGKKSSKKLWYIIGGVVLVGGIAAAAAGGGGGGGGSPAPTPLAAFPGPPGP